MLFGKLPSKPVQTHCKREVMHAIWELLLDEEFMKAYKEGLIITCGDGITWKVFPRLFTYSANYPEKWVITISIPSCCAHADSGRVLLATLKFLGNCPCVQCLVEREKIFQLGSKLDMQCQQMKWWVDSHPRQVSVWDAQRQIFQFGRPVNSKIIDNIMVHSSVPIEVSSLSFSL